ncbi:hypothetical protein [Photobacterium indicum]|uniref:hypothetical protein n=1 Tax=Photobacterium indicum TaxID=81447 RepID=UPI003D11DA4B
MPQPLLSSTPPILPTSPKSSTSFLLIVGILLISLNLRSPITGGGFILALAFVSLRIKRQHYQVWHNAVVICWRRQGLLRWGRYMNQ